MKRVRFDANTATVALRNWCGAIWMNDTDTITLALNAPAVPTVADVFYIEDPGVVVRRVFVANFGGTGTVGIARSAAVSGFAANEAVTARAFSLGGSGRIDVSFCEAYVKDFASDRFDNIALSGSFLDELDVFSTVGVGVRGMRLDTTNGTTFAVGTSNGFLTTTSVSRFGRVYSPSISGGTVMWAGVSVLGSGNGAGGSSAGGFFGAIMGNVGAASRRMRVATRISGNPITIRNASAMLWGIDVSGIPAACILFDIVGGYAVINDVVGSAGNTDVGVDVSTSRLSVFAIGVNTASTVTGTAGDIRVAGPIIVPYARLTSGGDNSDVIDRNGNRLNGTAGSVVTRITSRVAANVPILAADPAAPIDGDTWIRDAGGVRAFRARIAGTTYGAVLT
jgi:hypothetical protein